MLVFLLGPTAAGKTDLSIALAKELDAEIISVDSALIYRGLNIGTAKPTMSERDGIVHHLIDIRDPWELYSVADFCADAVYCIADIQRRGKLPLLVGGTMMYFNALEKGLAKLPQADNAVRASLAEQAQRQGWPALHAELSKIDPDAAARIHPNDPQRLQRALEVYRLTGKPLSQLQAETSSPLLETPHKFALLPSSRAWLHARIAKRFDIMLQTGMLDEVRSLMALPGMHAQLPSMRSVGYRQAWEHLGAMTEHRDIAVQAEGRVTAGQAMESSDWVNKAIAATRQLAKRQFTWMRGMNKLETLSCDTLSIDEQLAQMCNSLTNHKGITE